MTMVAWLSRSLADVPAGDGWLTAAERGVLARLRIAKRRRDWRLGRFTAKAVVAAWLGVEPSRVEVLAGPGGGPVVGVDGAPAAVSLSLSHRADRAMAVVAGADAPIGCDLEVVEPRSDAFVAEWLAPAEQALVRGAVGERRALLANLVWTAKEASAKARAEGLRLNVRGAIVEPALDVAPAQGGWRPLRVAWTSGQGVDLGFWRAEPGWVMAVVTQTAETLEGQDPRGAGALFDVVDGDSRAFFEMRGNPRVSGHPEGFRSALKGE
jgi:4'-phosphopantetheinyl transferase